MQSVPQLLTIEQNLGVSIYQDDTRNDQNYLWKVIRDETWYTVTTQKPNSNPSVEKLTYVSCHVMSNIKSKLVIFFDCAGSCTLRSNT